MTSTSRPWQVGLSAAADVDFDDILLWTEDRFGEKQARLYREALLMTVASLSGGPSPTGARPRPEVGRGIHSLHVSRSRRRGRHLVLFRVAGERQIEVIRILHDGMDLARHLPSDEGET